MLNKSHSISATIIAEIRSLLDDAIEPDEPIELTDTFGDLGLNSLMLARLIIALEEEFGRDPFATDRSIVDVHTVGDLVEAYGAGATQHAAAIV